MYNLVYAELLKLKSSKIWWVLLAGAVLPVLLNLAVAVKEDTLHLARDVDSLYRNNEVALNMPIAHAVFAVLVGYVMSREFSDNTVNTLFTYPFRRVRVYLSKLIVLFLIQTLFFLLAYVTITLVSSIWAPESVSLALLWQHAQIYLLLSVMYFALIPLYALAAWMGKSIVPAILLGLAGIGVSLYLVSTAYGIYSPWSATLLLTVQMVDPMAHASMYVIHPGDGVVTLAVAFAVPFLVNVIYLEKMDVHSGS